MVRRIYFAYFLLPVSISSIVISIFMSATLVVVSAFASNNGMSLTI
jgi:hypothetical protein